MMAVVIESKNNDEVGNEKKGKLKIERENVKKSTRIYTLDDDSSIDINLAISYLLSKAACIFLHRGLRAKSV